MRNLTFGLFVLATAKCSLPSIEPKSFDNVESSEDHEILHKQENGILKLHVGPRARQVLSDEEIARLETMDAPTDHPRHFLAQPGIKREQPQWISEEMKEALMYYGNVAAAAYCPTKSLENWSCGKRCRDAAGINAAVPFKDEGYDIAGFVAINDQDKEILVTFRGTQSFTNWINNFKILMDVFPVHFDHLSAIQFHEAQILVHEGFFKAYLAVADKVRNLLDDLTAKNVGYTIHVTGHSMGGALATLAAADLRLRYALEIPMELTTFEAPRVGNFQFTVLLNYLFPVPEHNIRLTNGRDVVVHVPPYLIGYEHGGREIFIPPGTNEEQTAWMCDQEHGEDIRCASAYIGYSVDDHLFLPWGLRFGSHCEP